MRHRPDPTLVALADGRRVALDDVGDHDGSPVLYLHGAPDSRLSRHPDDGLTAAAGVRLLAVDRPGCGRSDADPGRTFATVTDDLVAVLDALEIERAAAIGWSAGAPFAAALAAANPDRIDALGLVAPAVPIDAYDDPAVHDAAGPGRRLFAEMAAEIAPDEVAAEVAPYALPDPADPDLVAAQIEDEGVVDDVPGGLGHLVAATVECVALGRVGLHDEVTAQATRLDFDLASVAALVTIWCGERDAVAPPAFAAWWAGHLPGSRLVEVAGAGHHLAYARWTEILRTVTSGVRPQM